MPDPFWGNLQKSVTDSELIEAAIARISQLYSSMLAFGTWAMVPKSQTDAETIEQAIARLIAAHNADEESHLAAGQSLQSHKASEIIDHLARSVYRDKLIFDRFQIDEHFSTIDGWGHSAGTELTRIAEMQILTTEVNSNFQFAQIRYGDSTYGTESFLQLPVLEVRIKYAETTGFNSHFEIGDLDDVHGYGFYIHDGNLYVAWYDSDEVYHEELISGVDITHFHTYRIDLSDGVNAIWSIDGAVKKTLAFIDTRAKSCYFNIILENTVASSHVLWVQSLHYDEDYLE